MPVSYFLHTLKSCFRIPRTSWIPGWAHGKDWVKTSPFLNSPMAIWRGTRNPPFASQGGELLAKTPGLFYTKEAEIRIMLGFEWQKHHNNSNWNKIEVCSSSTQMIHKWSEADVVAATWARNPGSCCSSAHQICFQAHGLKWWHPHSRKQDRETKENSST